MSSDLALSISNKLHGCSLVGLALVVAVFGVLVVAVFELASMAVFGVLVVTVFELASMAVLRLALVVAVFGLASVVVAVVLAVVIDISINCVVGFECWFEF